MTNHRRTEERRASTSQWNQPSPDSCSLPQEQEQNQEAATDVWLGADAAERRALAARVVQQWQQEAEHFVAQRSGALKKRWRGDGALKRGPLLVLLASRENTLHFHFLL